MCWSLLRFIQVGSPGYLHEHLAITSYELTNESLLSCFTAFILWIPTYFYLISCYFFRHRGIIAFTTIKHKNKMADFLHFFTFILFINILGFFW